MKLGSSRFRRSRTDCLNLHSRKSGGDGRRGQLVEQREAGGMKFGRRFVVMEET